MKKIYLILTLCCSALLANAQLFWTEDFGTGCNRGQLASAYSGSMGPWTIASSGTNNTYANKFFVGAQAAGNAIGTCGSVCAGTIDASLHLSNVALSVPGFINVGADTGASYFSGGICGLGYCAVTNTRAVSPTINCTGRYAITINFGYIEGGATTLDDASLWVSTDGGSTFTMLDNMAKTVVGSCTTFGTWTAYSFSLPAAANNNANVKIAFNWTNNDDGVGTDPSFAVDDITLTAGTSTGIVDNTAWNLEVYATGNNIMVKSDEAIKLLGVFDVLGRNISTSLLNSTINMENQPVGIYFVRVEIKGQVYTKKVFFK